ncbi:MAG: putative peptidase [Yoonia sp.]|jgi:predicted peptidase
MPQVIKLFSKKLRRKVFGAALKEGQQRKQCANLQKEYQMKSTVLIAVIAAGLTLTAMDVSAEGRGSQRNAPDFATLDTDASGTLTVAEIEAAGQVRFDAMDTDGNGALSLEEMVAARDSDATGRAARMISRMDENDDGELQADEMTRRGPDADRMVARADTDDDGEISEAEFDAAAEKRGGRGHKGGHGHKGGKDRG